jgi:hypothetical protein
MVPYNLSDIRVYPVKGGQNRDSIDLL